MKPNVGAIGVPDPVLDVLNQHIKAKRTIVSEIKLVDIAGLVRWAAAFPLVWCLLWPHILSLPPLYA